MNRIAALWKRNVDAGPSSRTLRPGMLGIPPTAAECSEERDRILIARGDGLQIGNLRLVVLCIGNQDVEIGCHAGLVIDLEQMKGFFRRIQCGVLGLQHRGVMFQCA